MVAVMSRMYVQDNRRASRKILTKFHTNLLYGKLSTRKKTARPATSLIFKVALLSVGTTL